MKRKQWIALALAAALVVFSGCAAQETTQEPVLAEGIPVQIAAVESQDISTANRVSGTVTADEETSIYVSTNAKVLKVNFESGDPVKKGDVICTLDLGATIASYNAAQINYNSAAENYNQQKEVFESQIALYEKQIALQEKTLNDTKALFEIGAASQLEIDQASLQLESTRLQLTSAKAQRDSTLNQLRAGMESYRSNVRQLAAIMDDVDDQGNVIAPASGTLATLNAKEGGMVSAGMPVAVISGAEQMKITVSVSESLIPKLSVGDAVSVTVAAANAEFTGVIRSMDSVANPQTKLYTAVIGVPGDVTGLISGMFADVTFRTDTASGAIAVPTEAILTGDTEQYVYVVEDGKAKYVTVTTGLNGDGVTEVLSGLHGGEQLVTVGQQYLSDGETVRVVEG